MISNQSELLAKLTKIVKLSETGGRQVTFYMMLAQFKTQAATLKKIWSAIIYPYHRGIISDENMDKLRRIFEFSEE